MGRPWWHDSYWKRLGAQQSRQLRTTCPSCSSDKVYYNERFRIWRCGKCEGSFTLKVVEAGWDRRVWNGLVAFFKGVIRTIGLSGRRFR